MIKEYAIIWNEEILSFNRYDVALSNAKYLVADEISPKRYKALILEIESIEPYTDSQVKSVTLVEWLDDRTNNQFKIIQLM